MNKKIIDNEKKIILCRRIKMFSNYSYKANLQFVSRIMKTWATLYNYVHIFNNKGTTFLSII